MKTKKIRGHKRIWQEINKWKNTYLQLDLENLKVNERDYVKIWIHPYNGLTLTNSQHPEPRAETKKRILNGLFDIYENWQNQLNTLNQPYYLKIWLYEQRFTKSQVVCAIGNSLDFYIKTFNTPTDDKVHSHNYTGDLKNRIDSFNWDHHLDEDFMLSTDIGNPEDYDNQIEYLEDLQWFNKRLKKNHIKKTLKDGTECYSFEMGNVWVGGK